MAVVSTIKLPALGFQEFCMEPSADCVVQPLVSTAAKYHVIPLKCILYHRFGKDNLPNPRLCWIGDVNNHLKGMDLFMSVVIGIISNLLLQLDVLSLIVDMMLIMVTGLFRSCGRFSLYSVYTGSSNRFTKLSFVMDHSWSQLGSWKKVLPSRMSSESFGRSMF